MVNVPCLVLPGIQFISCYFPLTTYNARLSGEQHRHNTQPIHRKHKSQIRPKPPSVANPS
ncbi:hypothetical protein FY552_17990 [Vibrio cholerae]|nr:hypothetical protein FY552_17990 [Vibrio cholerae]